MPLRPTNSVPPRVLDLGVSIAVVSPAYVGVHTIAREKIEMTEIANCGCDRSRKSARHTASIRGQVGPATVPFPSGCVVVESNILVEVAVGSVHEDVESACVQGNC